MYIDSSTLYEYFTGSTRDDEMKLKRFEYGCTCLVTMATDFLKHGFTEFQHRISFVVFILSAVFKHAGIMMKMNQ